MGKSGMLSGFLYHRGRIWGFPKNRGTILGVPVIRTIVFWGLYWDPLFMETTIYIYIYMHIHVRYLYQIRLFSPYVVLNKQMAT